MKNEGDWINEDPMVKQFVVLAKQYYTGSVQFVRNGIKTYTAKLDPKKLKLKDCQACEAYFDLNRVKCQNTKNMKEIFFLRMIEAGNEINITLM
jgi:hypothetical protein